MHFPRNLELGQRDFACSSPSSQTNPPRAHVHISIYIYMNTHVNIDNMYTVIYIYMHIYIFINVHMYVYVYVYVYIYTLSILHIYIYSRISNRIYVVQYLRFRYSKAPQIIAISTCHTNSYPPLMGPNAKYSLGEPKLISIFSLCMT